MLYVELLTHCKGYSNAISARVLRDASQGEGWHLLFWGNVLHNYLLT